MSLTFVKPYLIKFQPSEYNPDLETNQLIKKGYTVGLYEVEVLARGDTLFLGGCGRFFEGSADQMYRALISILSTLPDHTQVFCGHEYSLQNLKFAAHVEPDNEDIKKKIVWSMEKRQEGKPTVPSTIAEEKLYNPFMRVTEDAVMKHAKSNNPIETMKAIRLEKDNFKG